jgi:PIN domain nuclease of toxin-antitoxin system
MAIKVNLQKLALGMPFEQAITLRLTQNGISVLSVELPHTFLVARLPLHHRDPFDRMICAQSLVEGLPLLSDDSVFDLFGVNRVW